MAKGDVKYSRSRGGYSSGNSEYDDEGRGASKAAFDAFSEAYAATGYDCKWLSSDDETTLDLVWMLKHEAVDRYGKHDWVDRIAALIAKHCGEEAWIKFSTEQVGKADHQKADWDWMSQIANQIGGITYQRERDANEAKRILQLEEETNLIHKEAELVAGTLQSDFHLAFELKERAGQLEGEWLDDPVDAYITGYGFGEEIQEQAGIKLQITLSLDLSNSMYYNDIHVDAAKAFRNLYMALKELKSEFETELFIAPFTFSDWEDGKGSRQIKGSKWDNNKDQDFYLGEMEKFRFDDDWTLRRQFSGEDTWLYPLFEKIENWENADSDPGAYRLDLIISDAVLEHPTDIRKCNEIQERRDGALQTVILNLMPEEEWHDSALPLHCVQYLADKDNLAGLLRNILMEFVQVYV